MRLRLCHVASSLASFFLFASSFFKALDCANKSSNNKSLSINSTLPVRCKIQRTIFINNVIISKTSLIL